MRRLVLAVTLMAAAQSSTVIAAAPGPDQAIYQAVLAAEQARWPNGRVPCISTQLKGFGSPSVGPAATVLAPLRAPFSFCRSERLTDRYLLLSTPRLTQGFAQVEVEYQCPLFGRGSLYALRRTGTAWRVVERQLTWIS